MIEADSIASIGGEDVHVLGQAFKVLLLLGELLLELQELLALTLADDVVLIGLLSSLESIAARVELAMCNGNCIVMQEALSNSPLASSPRGSASITLTHGTGRGGKASQRPQRRGLAEGGSQHLVETKMEEELEVVMCGRIEAMTWEGVVR